jgi:hypothetical protein
VPAKVGAFDDAKGTLSVIVPEGAKSGPLSMAYGCALFTGFEPFVVDETPAATVSGVSPTTAALGAVVTLQGAHFTGASSVTFGGVDEEFTIVDDGTILVQLTAPPAAGRVGVTTASGTGYSNGSETVSP